jgi:adenylyl- and sulfurtransferase ThiI
MTRQYRAVSLLSGGLDSMLATKAVLEQGIHVEGINFYTGFCVEGHTHAIRKHRSDKIKRTRGRGGLCAILRHGSRICGRAKLRAQMLRHGT